MPPVQIGDEDPPGGGGTGPTDAAVATARARLSGAVGLAEERVQIQGPDGTLYGPARLHLSGPAVTSIAENDDEHRVDVVLGLLREDLVAAWDRAQTLLSIGTSYVNIYSVGAGLGVEVDFTGKTQVAALVNWNVNGGSGDQTVRGVDAASPTDVLFESDILVTGANQVALAAIPAHFSGVVRILLQAKSTTGADSPKFESASVRLK